MPKKADIKTISTQLIKDYGEVTCKSIIKELQKLLDLCLVKVYYSGELDESKKVIIDNWVKNKVTGYYETEYIKDESLISGLKIVYKDFDYEDTLLSDFRKMLWNK